MRALKIILILMAMAGLMMALNGCGISEDEHQKVVSELNQTKSLLDKANAKIAQLEKSVTATQDQGKTGVKMPEGVDSGLKEKLATAQEEANNLRSKVESLTKANIDLKGLLEQLKEKLAQIESKLKGLQGSSGSLGSDLMKKR